MKPSFQVDFALEILQISLFPLRIRKSQTLLLISSYAAQIFSHNSLLMVHLQV